jgi:hypothetical protein
MRLMRLLWHRSDVQRVRVREKGDHVSAYCARCWGERCKNVYQNYNSCNIFLVRVYLCVLTWT